MNTDAVPASNMTQGQLHKLIFRAVWRAVLVAMLLVALLDAAVWLVYFKYVLPSVIEPDRSGFSSSYP